MAQAHEFNTYQLYQRYHKLIHSSRDMQTYMHFGAVARTNAPSQTEILPGYLKEMIEGLINDFNRFGDSWLLQAVLNRELPAVHVLDHSAILYVHTAVFSPEEKPKLTNKWIPFTSMYSESVGGLQYADPKAYSFTVDIRSENLLHYLARALQLYAQKKELQKHLAASAEEKNALNSQIAGLKDELFGLRRELEAAQNALHNAAGAAMDAEKQKLLEAARSEAQQIIASANAVKADADDQLAVIGQARAALDEELAEKRRQHDAALEAERRASHTQLAELEADMRRRLAEEVRQEAASAREALRGEFAAPIDAASYVDVRSAVSDATISMQRSMTLQLDASAQALGEAKAAMVQEIDSARAGMAQQLDAFLAAFDALRQELTQSLAAASERTVRTGSELAQSMDASAATVGAIKGSILQELQDWRMSLFKQDASRLASIYTGLYAYTNRNLAQEAARLLVTLDAQKDAPVIAMVNSMQSKCASLLVSLEAAMRDLGMELFTPGDSEPFDDVFHRAVNEEALEADATAAVVRACMTPGIRMAGSDGAIVRKAEVMVAGRA